MCYISEPHQLPLPFPSPVVFDLVRPEHAHRYCRDNPHWFIQMRDLPKLHAPACNGVTCEECGDEICEQSAKKESATDDYLCESCACECAECGDILKKSEARQTAGGDYLCDDCSTTCEGCSNTFSINDEDGPQSVYVDSYVRRNRESQCMCNECSTECADCNERFVSLSAENSSGEAICQSCAENYSSCEECGAVIHSDDCHSNDSGVYCRDCYRDEESSASVHSYGYKPRPDFRRAVGEARPRFYLGVEIETEKKSSDTDIEDAISESGLSDNDLYYCKDDGSLSNGFEIVSHPSSYQYWMSEPLKEFGKLARLGYRSYDTSSCGMHIHFSRSALTEAGIAKLLLFVKGNRQFIKFISRRGESNNFAQYSPIDDRSTGALIAKAKSTDSPRYTAVNLENDKTIEFRIFRGTLDVSAIRRNIAIVYAMVRFIQTAQLRKLTVHALREWIADNVNELGTEAGHLLVWIAKYLGELTSNPPHSTEARRSRRASVES